MQKEKGVSTLVGIIIIIAVAVVAFGGVFTYQYFAKSQILSTKSQTNSNAQNLNTQTAGWETYTNERFGIELEYPTDVLAAEGDNQYSKTIMLIDKRFVGKNMDLAIVPNYFSIDLAKDNSIDSFVEGERIFSTAPKSQITVLRTEEMIIDGQRAVKVVMGDKSTKIEKGFFIVAELPHVVSISPLTYNMVSFSGNSETPGFIDRIVGSIKFLK